MAKKKAAKPRAARKTSKARTTTRMANQKTPNPAPGGEVAKPGGPSVDQIREIIFGNQMQAYENRFLTMEEKVAAETASLREAFGKRLDELEASLAKHVKDLKEQLSREALLRGSGQEQLLNGIQTVTKALEDEAASIAAQADEDRAAFERQLREQAAELSRDLKATNASLEKHVASLQDAKTNRSDLSRMLTDLAEQLQKNPSGKKNASGR